MEPKTKNNLIISGFLIFDVLLIWFTLSHPLKDVRLNIDQYFNTKKEISAIEEKMNHFQQFEQKYKDYKVTLSKMEGLIQDNLFIDGEIPVRFTESLESWAKDLGIEIQISSTKIQKSPLDFRRYVGYKIALISNNVTPLLCFLKKLENSQWVINISNVSLSLEQDKDKNIKIVENIFVKVYVK